MVVGERRAGLETALAADGIDLVSAPPEGPALEGDEVRQVAFALRAYEGALGEGVVDGVVLAGSSNGALAALLVATKLRVPVASVDGDGPDSRAEPRAELNARLIAQLCDAALRDDATAVAAWVREAQAASRATNGD